MNIIDKNQTRYHINVEAKTRYLSEQSRPGEQRYAFSYTITLHNKGELSAQLISRYWLITDADGGHQEVEGEGVVGEQPHIEPGRQFQYTSGVLLTTPVGVMEGHYVMQAKDGTIFNAEITPFRLSIPNIVQ